MFGEEETFQERIFINGSPVTPNGNGDVRTGVIDVMSFNNGSSSLHDSLRVFANSFNKTKSETFYKPLLDLVSVYSVSCSCSYNDI